MRYIIVYLLLGILITTLTIKAMFDDPDHLEKLMREYNKNPTSVFAASIIVTLMWPYCLFLAIKKTIERHK